MKRIAGLIGFLFVLWLAALVFAPYGFRKLHFSPILFSREGKLLAARISADGQWRFPVTDSLSERYERCLTFYEDRRFHKHIGFDPLSLARAWNQNRKSGKVVSGGSTLTMQLARLLRGNPPRNYWNKAIEIWLAVGLEFNFSKKEILRYYASLAPYGGNVVGIDAAAWRYFMRPANQLSWAEAALLAVLPNQPSVLHLKRQPEKLKAKRDRLLRSLKDQGVLNAFEYEMSLMEPLPDGFFDIPQKGSLLLEYLLRKFPDRYRFHSTIQADLQDAFISKVWTYMRGFRENEIHNSAVLLVDNRSREVLVYIANNPDTSRLVKSAKVNNIHALRSTGSILKPLLYAAALDRGIVTRKQLMPDVPTLIAGFRPENFSRSYEGAVPLDQSLQRSLNVPAVRLLRMYGVSPFYEKLKQLGMTGLANEADHYGLSLILGGAEISAWNLAEMYSSLAYQLNQTGSLNDEEKRMPNGPVLLQDADEFIKHGSGRKALSDASIFEMMTTLQEGQFPEDLSHFPYRSNTKRIAWKTGTSFGFKDAWCVGVTPEYTMVVWVGNSNGVGRPGLIGLHTAAPLLFECFQKLTTTDLWPQPFDDMYRWVVCKESGYPLSLSCESADTVWHPAAPVNQSTCPYHERIWTDPQKLFRVVKDCEPDAVPQNWFVLPPVMEYYYKTNHPAYKSPPPVREDCRELLSGQKSQLEFIYPDRGAEIYVPVDLDDQKNTIVLKATHKSPGTAVHWFLDGSYLGATADGSHEWIIQPAPGRHALMIADDAGHSATAVLQCHGRER